MPYGNYSFVIDSNFQPFSMQELLTPMLMYKEAYDKQEAAYNDLADKSDKFKYLSETLPEDSKARQIYEGYANDLDKQAKELLDNNFNLRESGRGLLNLKRRYQGEIGKLVTADEALQKEKELRRAMSTKDSSMLYALDDLNIDDFLNNNTPNLYNISGTELYTRGAAAGKVASSRIYSAGDEGSTLNGYYRKWVERNGYSKESMNAFRANVSSIPELQQAAEDILIERGVIDGLKDNPQALQRARQSVINGIIDGAVYKEDINPVRDAGVMTASEKAADDRARATQQLQRDRFEYEKSTSGITVNDDGTVTYDPAKDAAYQRMKKLSEDGAFEGYHMGPNDKFVKDSSAPTAEEKAEDKKGAALMKLDRATLASKNGFDVSFGNDRQHYDYMGALAKHGDKWYSGKAGEDDKGHEWLRGWGFGSTSNVENIWGNYTYKPGDNAKMRVLSQSEIGSLMNDKEIAEHINTQLYSSGYYNKAILSSLMSSQNLTKEQAVKLLNDNGYKYTNDVQIVAVGNEWPHGDRENYLVAVRTK